MEKLISEFSIGLFFWQLVIFLALLFLLRKLAWKPILQTVNDREKNIRDAMEAAEKTKKEMALLQSQNEDLLKKAREERDSILREARETKDNIIAEAKNQAKAERDRDLAKAREEIHFEKEAAKKEIKNMVAQLSIDIAEKLIKRELSADSKQNELVKSFVDDIKLN